MGNRISASEPPTSKTYDSVETFQFHGAFPEDSNNGLYLNNVYFPEEVVTIILSHVDSDHILKCSEVCKKWCNIVKSHTLWAQIYQRRYRRRPKKLPWYVYYCLFATNYFDTNLIKNGNGQEQYKHWTFLTSGGRFQIEDPPIGANYLPHDVPEFNGNTSCFVTSYIICYKYQEVSFENNKLMQLIFNKYKPQIYVSEWVAGRFNNDCTYNLWCKLYGSRYKPCKQKRHRRKRLVYSSQGEDEVALHMEQTGMRAERGAGSEWTKVEMLIKDYPDGVSRIRFKHGGKDIQWWTGHHAGKMAGGVLKILFDSIVGDCDK